MPRLVPICAVLAGALACGADLNDCNTAICQLASNSTLAELRWPDFHSYRQNLLRLYQSTGYTPIWIRNGAPSAAALSVIEALKAAGDEGLNPEDYDASRWDGRIASLCGGDPNRFEIALTVAAMRYASDLRYGRANPQMGSDGAINPPESFTPMAGTVDQWVLTSLANASNAPAAFLALSPPFDGYWRARSTLAQYRRLALEAPPVELPSPQKPIEPGQKYPALARLVEALHREGDLPSDANIPPDGEKYDGAVADAVKRFQSRHGLEADGRLGKGTLAALNTPITQRVRQLELALERYRWIPHGSAKPMIVVNIPEFRLRAFGPAGGAPELGMKIVAGKARRLQTPVFGADMKYVIFRPYWNVPPSIQRKELIPNVVRDPAYLANNAYEVVTPGGSVVSTGVVSDEVLAGLRSGRLQVRQRPGAKNALGSVKFLLPNENDVYLHDTPSKTLFSRARRDFSHGCIRVEKPLDLALWVLKDRPEWTREKILAAMDGSMPVQVDLLNPIPVSIVYWTAIVPENGTVYFFDDIYGLDAELDRALTSGGSAPRPRG